MCDHFSWSTFTGFCISRLRCHLSLGLMTKVWNWMMARRTWLIGHLEIWFLFLFIVIVILRSLIPSSPCGHHSWVSSMTSRGTVEVITSVVFIFHFILKLIDVWSTSAPNIFLVFIFFKDFLLSFFNMDGYSSFVNSLNILSLSSLLSILLQIIQNLSFELQMLILKSLYYLLILFIISSKFLHFMLINILSLKFLLKSFLLQSFKF